MIAASAEGAPTGGDLPRGLQWILFVRSLSLQASWNQQRMQNLGLLWSMLAWLRRQPREVTTDRVFCRRYFGFFNTNPYLANFLLGGLVRLQDEQASGRDIPPALVATFRDTVGRALASLGDQLFWLGLRPTLVMLICLAGLLGEIRSILWVVGIFAGGQLALRWCSLRAGYGLGLDIVDLLVDPRWHRWIDRIKRTGMVLTGVVAGLYLSRVAAQGAGSERILLWLGVGLGMGLPVLVRQRFPGEVLILLALVLALLLGFAI